MSASSDDADADADADAAAFYFYSAPDCSPSNSTQTPPPDRWLSRMASSAGKLLSLLLALSESDASTTDDESHADHAPHMLTTRKVSAPSISKINRFFTQFDSPNTLQMKGNMHLMRALSN